MKYYCQPLSRADLRNYAKIIRSTLQLEDPCFPVIRFLELLHLLINDEELHFQIIDDSEWNQPKERHAYYDATESCIYIRESIYNGACAGNGRDRMTIVHECAHVLLIKHSHVTLARAFDDRDIPAYCDPEWQAKCLAGELMVPADLVKGWTAKQIADSCGVSITAAHFQLSKI